MAYQQKLTTRARTVLVIVPLALLIILVAIGYALLTSQLHDNAKQTSRQYAVQVNLDFQQYMTPSNDLLRQVARSWLVSRWMDDIAHPQYREEALEHIEALQHFNPYAYLMFTSAEAGTNYHLQAYYLHGGMNWVVTPHQEQDWLDTTLNSPRLIHMGVEANGDREPLFWLHHRVYFQGNSVGVASVGFSLASFMHYLFGALPAHVHAYVVDAQGVIHLNSGEDGANGPQYLTQVINYPGLLARIDGYFQLLSESAPQPIIANSDPGVFGFNLGIADAFHYGSPGADFANVNPLAGTTWVLVLTSTREITLNNLTFLPLFVAIIVAISLISLLGSTMLRKHIINPLEQLALSVTRFAARSSNDQAPAVVIYGTDRDDEIGYLATSIESFIQTMLTTNEELKQVQVLEASNQAKSQFLARMSHEIRTPISAILGISETQIKNGDLTPQTQEALHKIYASGNLLLGIINDILDLSRIEHGSMEIIPEPYPVAAMISDVMQRYMEIAIAKSLNLEVQVNENLPAHLTGDALRIQQVLNNILSNAFKYTLRGGVSVSFDMATDDTDLSLTITITDTGIGMSPEQVAAIFDEYARFSEKEYRSIDGTGLGMPIVSHLLGLMNGQIQLQSTPDVGTTVVLTIPQQVDDPTLLGADTANRLRHFKETAFRSTSLPQFTIEPLPHGRVLIVDDLEVNLYVAQEILAMYDLHTIDTAMNGRKAIEMIQAGQVYDIVFMDHMMPGLDGVETLERLREAGYTKPIVALTANAMIGQESKFLAHGFDDFLSKPIQTKRMDQVLRRFIPRTHLAPVPVPPSPSRPATSTFQPLQQRIQADFQYNHAHAVTHIRHALDSHDTKQAHLAIHSLKGVAGLLGATSLVEVAADMEALIRENDRPTPAHFARLQAAIDATLDTMELLSAEPQPWVAVTLDPALPLATSFEQLLDQLTPLVAANSTTALALIPQLAQHPNTASLIDALENFDFHLASEQLATLR